MRRRARRPVVGALLTLFAVAIGLGACGGGGEITDENLAEHLNGAVLDDPLEVGELSLPEVDPAGQETPFEFRAPPGELLGVYFGFTYCPDVCPKTLADIRTALEDLDPADAERFSLAMVTVDPQRDTPEVLNAYVGSFLDRSHALRTTDPDELAAVQAGFLASSSITPSEDGEGYEVSHTATTALVDDTGTVIELWPFGLEPDLMAEDLQILLDRAEERASTTQTPEEGS